jgi:ribosomal protein L37AE/L43A
MANKTKPKLALILGSGFSREAGLPTTNEIPDMFLKTPESEKNNLQPGVGDEISRILGEFWKEIFAHQIGKTMPSIEDHFTLLDLAANSGHHLGKHYSPKKLRAIRRMSIHRVFSLVTEGRRKSKRIHELLSKLIIKFDLSLVTLNWDIVVERHLNRIKQEFYSPVESFNIFDGTPRPHVGIPLMKMHGSASWVYCDSCRRIFAGKISSPALNRTAFLEADDFKLFETKKTISDNIERSAQGIRDCPHCGNKFAGRVATFSFRKAFSINQFQTIWERAHASLRDADRWLFIGYSMPDADFEFKHLLKSAQLARKKPENWSASVIFKDDTEAANRYKSFFGLEDSNIHQNGLSKWVDSELKGF